MRRLAAIAIALCLGTAGAAQAQAPSPTTPPEKIDPVPVQPQAPDPSPTPPVTTADPLGVPATVLVVRVAGPWAADGKRGFSRVVGVIDGDRQRFYVQWLQEPDGVVVETTELKDEDAADQTFGDVRAEPSDTGVTVFFDTVPDKDGLRDTWVLVIGEPGEARFGPATN